MKILTLIRLGPNKVVDKITPMTQCNVIERIWLIRHARVELNSDKVIQLIHDANLNEQISESSIQNRLLNLYLVFRNAIYHAKNKQVDVISAFNLMPYGIIAWAVGRITRKKVCVSLIGTDFNLDTKSNIYGFVVRAILKNIDWLTIFGEKERQELISYGIDPSRVFVLPNTLDITKYRPTEYVKSEYDLVFVGYLRKLKRIDLVLEMLKKIHQYRPQTNLLIVGEGEERENLEALSNLLGLTHAVNFSGWSDTPVEELRKSRIFVSFSATEGLPMTMIEAMCTGVPVIVTNVGAINTVIKHQQNGYLLESPPDLELATKYVLNLLDNQEHYDDIQLAGFETGPKYSYDNSTKVWDNIFSEISSS